MSLSHSPKIITNGLVMYLDAANRRSYSGAGSTWLDITPNQNNVSLLNTPNFTSNNRGGIVFDGIDDYAIPNISHSYLSSSALEVWFNSSSHGSGFKTIFGYRHNGGYSRPTIGSIYLDNNTLSASVITAAEVYRTATFATAISTNRIYHVVLNKDTVNGTLQLFVNGVAGSSQTFNAATYGQWTTAGSYIGANALDIAKSTNSTVGQGWGSDYFNGTIFKLAVYGKILTLSEIQNNFNAMRGRFGI